ncbi:MAG TPA: rod shape-determining protein MreC [Candidatus Limnocylindrales bacterium]
MSSLLASRSARRRGGAYAALLALTLVLMAFSSSEPLIELQKGVAFAFRPIQSGLTGFARGATDLVATIGEIDTLRSRNQLLEQENQQLRAENDRMGEVRRENELLTGLLQLRNGLSLKTVAGEVIGRESSEFLRVVSIDAGEEDGVRAGDVVIAAGGALAGRVTEVGRNFATVLLINDTSSTVIGQDQSNAATGEVIGQLGGVLIMEDIDSTARLQIGEDVVTAGIELASGVRSPFPKGLLIGQVVDLYRDANAVTQTAYLKAAADLDKLEYVLVITDYQGGLPDVRDQPTQLTNPDGTLPDSEQPFVTPLPSGSPGASPVGSASPPGASPVASASPPGASPTASPSR